MRGKYCIGAAITFVIAGALAAPVSAKDDAKASQSACFARLKKLAGDWYAKDPNGKERLAVQYRVISGGTALEEVLMPGSEEMVSIYHMDGDSLVMTHYCLLGNQPHLKATAASTPSRIEFECTGHGGNMKSENDMHIHHAVFNLGADDHFTSMWGANSGGKSAGPEQKFELHRKAK